ncbi:hypothetical protein H4R35_001341 [Dimargaris xerosporica]|nr:hypothetical protein H4R35_001341 [Dimargaris xerosporica]
MNEGARRLELMAIAASNAVNAKQQFRDIRHDGQKDQVPTDNDASKRRLWEEYVKLAGSAAATSNTLRGF